MAEQGSRATGDPWWNRPPPEQGSDRPPAQQSDPQRDAEQGTRGGQSDAPQAGQPGAPRDEQSHATQDGQRRDRDGGQNVSDPDVVLQVPKVKVEQICLEVDNLDAHVSLRARLANLLQLDIGVQARLGAVKLDIKGVETEALLEVRLEELAGILDRALSTIDRNPQILEAIVRTLDTTMGQVGQTTQQALGPQGPQSQTLQQTIRQVGQQVGQATGQLTEQVGQTARQAGQAAADGAGGGLGAASIGSSARAAWQRTKQILNNPPIREVTARLVPHGKRQ